MTNKQKKLLLEIYAGSDVNMMAQIARIAGPREENLFARTGLALYKKGLLQIRKGGGLEISDKGRLAAERINARNGAKP